VYGNEKYVPPAPGVKSPALWGTEQRLRELFGNKITRLTINRRFFTFRYRSPQHWLEIFRTYYGPLLKAYAGLDTVGQAGLTRDLTDLLERFNQGGIHTLAVPGEYLDTSLRSDIPCASASRTLRHAGRCRRISVQRPGRSGRDESPVWTIDCILV
jgi:hypothetical protein